MKYLQTEFLRISIIIILVCLTRGSLTAQILSPDSKISLITVGPGDELYSGFGHSAFWVYDPKLGMDRIYNYGTFDFNEDFYFKFISGKLDYLLSVSDLNNLGSNAQEEGRYMLEQELNLNQEMKEKLFLFLEHNYLPENRVYRYDFFYDNCSSRLRDALKFTLKDDLKYDLSENLDLSFRQLIDQFLLDKEVQDFGMDIGLGAPADVKATPLQYMFLPEYLKKGFDKAQVNIGGTWKPLVTKTTMLIPAKRELKIPFFSPLVIMSIVLLIIGYFTWRNFKYGIGTLFWDALFLAIAGLLGCLLIFLWFFTDHRVTSNNWDLLWAMPFHLIVLFLFKNKKFATVLQYYFFVYGLLCFLLFIFSPILPEELNKAVLPLLIIIALRSMYLHRYFRKKAIATNIT